MPCGTWRNSGVWLYLKSQQNWHTVFYFKWDTFFITSTQYIVDMKNNIFLFMENTSQNRFPFGLWEVWKNLCYQYAYTTACNITVSSSKFCKTTRLHCFCDNTCIALVLQMANQMRWIGVHFVAVLASKAIFCEQRNNQKNIKTFLLCIQITSWTSADFVFVIYPILASIAALDHEGQLGSIQVEFLGIHFVNHLCLATATISHFKPWSQNYCYLGYQLSPQRV